MKYLLFNKTLQVTVLQHLCILLRTLKLNSFFKLVMVTIIFNAQILKAVADLILTQVSNLYQSKFWQLFWELFRKIPLTYWLEFSLEPAGFELRSFQSKVNLATNWINSPLLFLTELNHFQTSFIPV